MTNKSGQAVVIGGGLGGLAAACVLAARGRKVLLLEKNSWVGGKAAVLHVDGFRFDMGPTILTLPSVLRRIFSEAGETLEDHLDLIRLDPQWRSFFGDGSVLDLHQEVEKMAASLPSFTGTEASADEYRKFLSLSEKLNHISQNYFFYRSIGGLRDMFDARAMVKSATLKDVLQMRMGATVGGTIRRHLKDPRVSQMLDHFTQYVGSAPDASPAVLCGIAHMQTDEGVWYPRGGTRAVAEALEKLALRLGVAIRCETEVSRITASADGVTGVLTETKEYIPAETVVSNSDAVRTFRELLPEHPESARFERRRKYEAACSGVVLYLGLRKRYEHILHHNFVFSRDPHEEFEFIYRKGEPAPDPTCYVCAPSLTEKNVAPEGGEALYILVHAPYLRPHHNWSEMLPKYRKTIIEKLKRTGGMEDIESRIAVERVLTPRDIHERYRVLNGAIYGLASHGRFFGAFKPGNRTAVKGLYLCGGAAHPGPGMPMVMMSGWIAGDVADRDMPQAERAEPKPELQLEAA